MENAMSRKRPRSDSDEGPIAHDRSLSLARDNPYPAQYAADESLALQPKSYHSNVIHGGVTHFGDNVHLHYSTDSRQAARTQFLSSLRYADMNLRQNQITDAEAGTFSWLMDLEAPSSTWNSNSDTGSDQDWHTTSERDSSHVIVSGWLRGQTNTLCVVGKPGCGKSTLLKFLATHPETVTSLEATVGRPVSVYSHYFWLRGSEAQRSLKGLWANLLWQICDDNPSVLDTLLSRPTLQKKASFSDWSTTELQGLVLNAITSSDLLCICIDGLDEIDSKEDLTPIQLLVDASRDEELKLLLSSRQEPRLHWILASHPTLVMHQCTWQDMYLLGLSQLQQALSRAEFTTVTSKNLVSLSRSIADRAEGIFMWTCLVIGTLAQALNNSADLEALRQLIQVCPTDIKELYTRMLARNLATNGRTEHAQSQLIACLVQDMPINLLQYTLTLDDQLREKVIHASEEDEGLLHDIFVACRLRETQLHWRTAGLLTTVREGGAPPGSWQGVSWSGRRDEKQGFYKNEYDTASCELCAVQRRSSELECYFKLLDPHEYVCSKCATKSASSATRYMHDTTVIPVHRSAAEFLYEQHHTSVECSTKCCESVQDSLCHSYAAAYKLGCDCMDSADQFDRFYDSTSSREAIIQRFRTWIDVEVNAWHAQPNGGVSPITFATNLMWRHRRYPNDFYGPDNGVVDLGSIAASRAASPIIQELLYLIPKPMRKWYLGVLVIAAVREIWPEGSYSGKFGTSAIQESVISTLGFVRDQFSLMAYSMPHIIPREEKPFNLPSFIIRTPAEECLLALFRLVHTATVTGCEAVLISELLDMLQLYLAPSSMLHCHFNSLYCFDLPLFCSKAWIVDLVVEISVRNLSLHIKDRLAEHRGTKECWGPMSNSCNVLYAWIVRPNGEAPVLLLKPAVHSEAAAAVLRLLDGEAFQVTDEALKLCCQVLKGSGEGKSPSDSSEADFDVMTAMLQQGDRHDMPELFSHPPLYSKRLAYTFMLHCSPADSARTQAEIERHYARDCDCAGRALVEDSGADLFSGTVKGNEDGHGSKSGLTSAEQEQV